MSLETSKTTVFFTQAVKSSDGLTRLYFFDRATRPDGKTKHITGAVIVENEKLLKRISKLETKAEIEIETTTDWDSPTLRTVLINFREIKTRRTNGFARSNGKPTLKQNEIAKEKELLTA